MYWVNDASQAEQARVGDTEAADRVSVTATIEKVDPAQYSATVRAWLVPRGRFTSDGGETANRDPGGLQRPNGGAMVLESGRRIAAQPITLELHRGEITHHPFDRYAADPLLRGGGRRQERPGGRRCGEQRRLLQPHREGRFDDVEPGLHLKLSRSPGTFMMVAR